MNQNRKTRETALALGMAIALPCAIMAQRFEMSSVANHITNNERSVSYVSLVPDELKTANVISGIGATALIEESKATIAKTATPQPTVEPTPQPTIEPTSSPKTTIKPTSTPTPVVEKKVASNRWGISLSKSEIDLLAKIVYLESGGESDKGQQAVVEVIFNRMYEKGNFPDTLQGVLSQRAGKGYQFVTWVNRNKAKPTERVYENIYKVLEGKTSILPYKTVFFSRGAYNNKIQIRIGGHVFCNM